MIDQTIVTCLSPEKVRHICSSLKAGVRPEGLVTAHGDGNNGHPLIRAEVSNNIRHAGEVLLCQVPANAGLHGCLLLQPRKILDELEESGLTGRGGAGFPTGRKWRVAADTPAQQRYVICNADEGEPGTFKDRVLLTERADLMVEGMTIAAFAIGSSAGIIYLRAEYGYLRAYLESVLQARREQGLLGRDISGKQGFEFDIRIQMGAGAYICGEESALISSCEGLRGEPKNRPRFRWNRDISAFRQWSTMWRLSVASPASWTGEVPGSVASAPVKAPAPSCSASAATAPGRESTSCPSASP